jgi:hypothetical protein
MKTKLFALIPLTLLATNALAAEKTEFTCSSSFGKSGPVQGYALEVTKNDEGTYTGTLYPSCTSCMVKPVELQFSTKTTGSEEVVYNGVDANLNITLESMVPTRSHMAVLETSWLNGGKPVTFTCVEE